MKVFPILPTFLMIGIGILLILYNRKKAFVFMILLLFCINERFKIPTNQTETSYNSIDVLFVIDNTISMEKEKRLEAAKEDCLNLIEELEGARFGVITFDNTAKVVIPFTRDTNTIKEIIKGITPMEEWMAHGTNLNTPYEEMKRVLALSPQREKVLFFMSDGEITDNSSLMNYTPLKKYIKTGAIVGYGTKKGERIKEGAISKLEEANLKQLANNLDIKYIHRNKEEKIQSVLNNISEKEKGYKDTYFVITPILLLLLVINYKKMRRDLL